MDNKAEHIFNKWCSELRSMDKSSDHIYENFYLLFYDLKEHKVSFDDAHTILNKAIPHHTPNSGIIKSIFKSRNIGKKFTEQEFTNSWKSLIKDKAAEAFYEIYPLVLEETGKPVEPPAEIRSKPVKASVPKQTVIEEDDDPTMTPELQKIYRDYAGSFPEIERKPKNGGEIDG